MIFIILLSNQKKNSANVLILAELSEVLIYSFFWGAKFRFFSILSACFNISANMLNIDISPEDMPKILGYNKVFDSLWICNLVPPLFLFPIANFKSPWFFDDNAIVKILDKLLKISNEYDIENLKQKYSKLKKEMNIIKELIDRREGKFI